MYGEWRPRTQTAPPPLRDRREALRRLGLLVAGLAAACTPMRLVLKLYPTDFETNPARTDRILRAFALTIVPGARADDPNLSRAFGDTLFPFSPYRAFFAADLCRRAGERFGTPEFDRLSPAQRTAVVQDGLGADATTRKLYTGAVFLTQLAVYSGIYDDAAGCPLIGFEGRYRFRGFAAQTHPEPERFLARAASDDGNPA